jgi:acyl-[acyl-carrier-protein]-phospholipid O-acyltransferase/long-chain-fatty-acid--[acyl-carrier-protein] ligase
VPLARDPRDVVRRLQERGLPNLWIPGADAFAEIGELPMLGSGKLDLKRLSDMARDRFAEAHDA